MSGSLSEDSSVGRSSEGNSSTQRCQSSEALSEWRSCEQVENGTPSTSPPYWDIDDDDDDSGPKPSELYGKFTWKIDKFSEISKRELRSNAFEVGGYKWYILIYPQGCDVCNHLSLFLCVANHDKLLPGWSHFAQFTIAVVNKDPKKSKYSDTLHRFWKKEHDWGWKKFMELSKVLDGFIVGDTLVIKAQVQVIREKSHRPFRCLDCQYRRELVRVYLTNVEQICRRFVDEKKAKLVGAIENKLQWSSFCTFWLEVDQNVRRRMSREKTDVVLREVVKHFFVEKEVTSTLVMDSLYSGLKALESQSKGKKGRSKVPDTVETSAPMVCVEKDMFTLADDVLLLLERAAMEPLPPKDEKGPQNRTKEGSSGEDFNKDSIERDERRLTELGRRTVEIFVLTTIFSTKIDVAYKEAVAFKRQEELIREEEAGQAGSEQKAKRGATEKEKRAKKKQSKQRRSSRKGKDKARDEKFEVSLEGKPPSESPTNGRSGEEFSANQTVLTIEKPGSIDDVSDVSDTADDATEMLQPDLEDRDASPVNWDTDTSEVHPATETSSSGLSGLPIQNGRAGKNNTSVMDDSSSTCSTDSVPSVVMNASYRGNSIAHYKSQTSANRRKNQRCKETRDRTGWAHDINSQEPEPAVDADRLRDLSGSCRAVEPESVISLKDRIHWLEQHSVEKEEEIVTLQKKLIVNDPVDVEKPSDQRMALEAAVTSTPTSPARNPPSGVQPKPVAGRTNQGDLLQVKETPSSSPRQAEKVVPRRIPSPHIPAASKPEVHIPAVPSKPIPTTSEKATASMSRPSSAPLVPGPRPTAAVVSLAAPTPLLSRSMSAAGRLGVDTAPATPSYAPQSYRNAIMGKTMGANPAGYTSHPSCSAVSPSPYSQSPSALTSQPTALISQPMHLPQNSGRMDQGLVRPGFTFGSVTPEVLHNQPQWLEGSQKDANKILCNPSLLKGIQNLDIYGSGGGSSGTYFSDEPTTSTSMRQAQGVGVSSDEFPHLDIINYLLDEEHSIGSAVFGPNIGHHHPLNRQYTFPGDMPLSMDVGPSANSCRFERQESYLDDGLRQVYGSPSGPYDGYRDIVPLVGLPYANGQIDGMMQSQWPIGGADLSMLNYRNSDSNGYLYQVPEYSNVACGVSGYPLFRPANGH